MLDVIALRISSAKSQTIKPVRPTTVILRSPNFSHKSSTVYRPTRAVTNRPTIFTLVIEREREAGDIKGL